MLAGATRHHRGTGARLGSPAPPRPSRLLPAGFSAMRCTRRLLRVEVHIGHDIDESTISAMHDAQRSEA